jgi:hypothetical protein
MSATLAPRVERGTRAAAERRAVRVAQRRVMNPMFLVGGAYWLIYAVVVAAIVVGNELAGNVLTRSILDVQWGGSSRWIVFVLGMIIPAALLRPHVAAGGTRRSLATGTLRAAVLVGLAFGVATAVYLVGERALFGALGMTWGEPDSGLPVDGVGGLAVRVLAEALVIATYTLSGAVISMGYFRYGIGRGTAFILVSLVPLVLVDLATRTGGLAAIVADWYTLDGAGAVVVGLAGGVVAFGIAAWLLPTVQRGIPLRPPV